MKFLLVVISIFSFLSKKSPTDQAQQYAKEAQAMYAEAKYGAGIILLEKANKLDSMNIDYLCEIASGYINVREYANAEIILKRLQYRREVSDKVYQLLGRLYKIQGKVEKSEDFLAKGLRFFPNSGRLYLEIGVLRYSQKQIPEAIYNWKKGTEVEPGSSSNYYWLSRHYAETDEKIWAVLYGEMFMLLEQNTFRSIEMSHILFEVYKTSFEESEDNPLASKFMSDKYSELIDPLSFASRFKQTMIMARRVTDLGVADHEVFYGISDIRYDFIEYWYDQRLPESYPFVVFKIINESYEMNFWDAYHAWLLLRWNEKEFKTWQKNNKKMYESFQSWISTYDVLSGKREFLFERKTNHPTND